MCFMLAPVNGQDFQISECFKIPPSEAFEKGRLPCFYVLSIVVHIPFCPCVAKAATKFKRSVKCVCVLKECVNVSTTPNGHVLYLNKGINYWCTHTDMQFRILNTGFKLGTSCHVLLISLKSCQMLETLFAFMCHNVCFYKSKRLDLTSLRPVQFSCMCNAS